MSKPCKHSWIQTSWQEIIQGVAFIRYTYTCVGCRASYTT
jgi:hypothetical protein